MQRIVLLVLFFCSILQFNSKARGHQKNKLQHFDYMSVAAAAAAAAVHDKIKQNCYCFAQKSSNCI